MKPTSATKFLKTKYIITILGLFIIGTAIYRESVCNRSTKEGFTEYLPIPMRTAIRPHIRTVKNKYADVRETYGLHHVEKFLKKSNLY